MRNKETVTFCFHIFSLLHIFSSIFSFVVVIILFGQVAAY